MGSNASWGGSKWHKKGKRLINPLLELAGGKAPDGRGKWVDYKGLELQVEDLLHIAPFLKKNEYMLCVQYWRDFSPSRTLLSTRPVYAKVINDIAKVDLCNEKKVLSMTETEIDTLIKAVTKFAEENKGTTEAQRLVSALKIAVEDGQSWYHLRKHSGRLVELKVKDAIPLLMKVIERPKASKFEIAHVLKCCARIDADTAVKYSEEFLEHEYQGVQVNAGIIFIRAGYLERGEKAIENAFRTGNRSNLGMDDITLGVETLLDTGSPEALAVARLALKNEVVAAEQGFRTFNLMKKFIDKGLPDAYEYYLARLEAAAGEPAGGSTKFENSAVASVARSIIFNFMRHDSEVREIQKMSRNVSQQQIDTLKAWLNKKIEAMKQTEE
jgi:hypothetical protein